MWFYQHWLKKWLKWIGLTTFIEVAKETCFKFSCAVLVTVSVPPVHTQTSTDSLSVCFSQHFSMTFKMPPGFSTQNSISRCLFVVLVASEIKYTHTVHAHQEWHIIKWGTGYFCLRFSSLKSGFKWFHVVSNGVDDPGFDTSRLLFVGVCFPLSFLWLEVDFHCNPLIEVPSLWATMCPPWCSLSCWNVLWQQTESTRAPGAAAQLNLHCLGVCGKAKPECENKNGHYCVRHTRKCSWIMEADDILVSFHRYIVQHHCFSISYCQTVKVM